MDTVRKVKSDLLKQRCNYHEAQELRDAKLSRIIEIEAQLEQQMKDFRKSKPLVNVVKHTAPKLF
jgi:hypothetical protein